jgi:hypothetical protein
MSRKPRYATNVAKAQEVILWLATRVRGIDVYHLVKAAYFAEKKHISEYGRPIVGDAYRAAPHGPLAQVIHGLLRHEPLDILALETNGDLPFSVGVDGTFVVTATREANPRMLSSSDVEALEHGARHVENRSFNDIKHETHVDPAYIRADGGMIDYRDMIADDDPQRKQKRAYIEESAQDTAL